jgi:hypothetical protein
MFNKAKRARATQWHIDRINKQDDIDGQMVATMEWMRACLVDLKQLPGEDANGFRLEFIEWVARWSAQIQTAKPRAFYRDRGPSPRVHLSGGDWGPKPKTRASQRRP